MAKRRPSGDGMVRKREDGRWEGRIVVGHKKNGTPIFQHAYAHTQKELTEKLHQNIERYQDVELTEDSRMTLGEWLDRWLTEYKAGTVRPGTLKSYRCYIEYYIKPQLGDKQISLISQQDIQRMYRRLKTEGRIHEHPEMNHQLSDSMVRHIHSALHAALKDAVQAHVIPRNPTEGATAPKPNYRPKRILTRAELDAFLEVVEQDEVWRDFFQTELMTGLRRGEICGLQWSDFDEEGGALKVCRTLHSQRKGEYTVGETKTGKGMRTIILPKTVADILRQRKADMVPVMRIDKCVRCCKRDGRECQHIHVSMSLRLFLSVMSWISSSVITKARIAPAMGTITVSDRFCIMLKMLPFHACGDKPT